MVANTPQEPSFLTQIADALAAGLEAQGLASETSNFVGVLGANGPERITLDGSFDLEALAKHVLDALTAKASLDPENYLWKWVERGVFDRRQSPRDALAIIASHPSAPWKNGRWDVDHLPYAKDLYARFPKAAAPAEVAA